MSLNYNIGFSTIFLIEEKIPLVKGKKGLYFERMSEAECCMVSDYVII